MFLNKNSLKRSEEKSKMQTSYKGANKQINQSIPNDLYLVSSSKSKKEAGDEKIHSEEIRNSSFGQKDSTESSMSENIKTKQNYSGCATSMSDPLEVKYIYNNMEAKLNHKENRKHSTRNSQTDLPFGKFITKEELKVVENGIKVHFEEQKKWAQVKHKDVFKLLMQINTNTQVKDEVIFRNFTHEIQAQKCEIMCLSKQLKNLETRIFKEIPNKLDKSVGLKIQDIEGNLQSQLISLAENLDGKIQGIENQFQEFKQQHSLSTIMHHSFRYKYYYYIDI